MPILAATLFSYCSAFVYFNAFACMCCAGSTENISSVFHMRQMPAHAQHFPILSTTLFSYLSAFVYFNAFACMCCAGSTENNSSVFHMRQMPGQGSPTALVLDAPYTTPIVLDGTLFNLKFLTFGSL
jgi:hypothetical protein